MQIIVLKKLLFIVVTYIVVNYCYYSNNILSEKLTRVQISVYDKKRQLKSKKIFHTNS